MAYRPKIDKQPFRADALRSAVRFHHDKIIKPAASQAGRRHRVLMRSEVRTLSSTTLEHLWRARLLPADVPTETERELRTGTVRRVGIPTIIITGKIEDVPFD